MRAENPAIGKVVHMHPFITQRVANEFGVKSTFSTAAVPAPALRFRPRYGCPRHWDVCRRAASGRHGPPRLPKEMESAAACISWPDPHKSPGTRECTPGRNSVAVSCRPARSGRRPSVAPEPSVRDWRSEEHTSELQSHSDLVCRLLLEKKK